LFAAQSIYDMTLGARTTRPQSFRFAQDLFLTDRGWTFDRGSASASAFLVRVAGLRPIRRIVFRLLLDRKDVGGGGDGGRHIRPRPSPPIQGPDGAVGD